MTPEEQRSFNWTQMKYGQLSLQAETFLEQLNALKAENAELKKKLEPEKPKDKKEKNA